MTKSVTIIITGSTQQAVDAVARRVVNTTDNVANWANTNHAGLITSIKANTQDVTVVRTKAEFVQDVGGSLVLAP